MMRRWIRRLLPPYGAQARRRRALAEARAWQDEERAAARARIAGIAGILDQPTTVLPTTRPLLTRAEAARTRPASR
jgi:hypothetical protein